MTKSTITRERLLEIIVTGPEASGAEQNELARMALAAMDSEPVGMFRKSAVGYTPSYHEDAVPLYRHAQPAPASPVCTCPSGDGSLRWPCPVHAGNSLVIPDGSASMLRRWLAFGRAMQNAGCQLPHNLIAETEAMLAAATQEAINALIPLVSRNEQEGK